MLRYLVILFIGLVEVSGRRCFRDFWTGSLGSEMFYEECSPYQYCEQSISLDNSPFSHSSASKSVWHGCGYCNRLRKKFGYENIAGEGNFCGYDQGRGTYVCCCDQDLCNNEEGLSSDVFEHIRAIRKLGVLEAECEERASLGDLKMPYINAIVGYASLMNDYLAKNHGKCPDKQRCCRVNFVDSFNNTGYVQRCIQESLMNYLINRHNDTNSNATMTVVCTTDQLYDWVQAGKFDRRNMTPSQHLSKYRPIIFHDGRYIHKLHPQAVQIYYRSWVAAFILLATFTPIFIGFYWVREGDEKALTRQFRQTRRLLKKKKRIENKRKGKNATTTKTGSKTNTKNTGSKTNTKTTPSKTPTIGTPNISPE